MLINSHLVPVTGFYGIFSSCLPGSLLLQLEIEAPRGEEIKGRKRSKERQAGVRAGGDLLSAASAVSAGWLSLRRVSKARPALQALQVWSALR